MHRLRTWTDRLVAGFTQSQPVLPHAAWLAWAAVIFTVPCVLVYRFTLNNFYHYGVVYADTGLFAHLLWHNGWGLMNPHYRGDFSYYGVHLSPSLLLINAASYLVPTRMPEFCAGWQAVMYGSLGLGMLYAFRLFLRPATHLHLALLALLCIGFSLNSVATKSLWMVHFEYFIPLGIFLFLLFYLRGKHWAAAITLGLVLMLREDAGFHLAALTGLAALIGLYETRRLAAVKNELILTVVAAGYSAFALMVVASIADAAGMARVIDFIYLGALPFVHVTQEKVMERLGTVLFRHLPVLIGLLLSLCWAWRTRNPYLAVGFVANIPWLVVNLLARNNSTGVLYAYYSFPFLIGFAWPFIAALRRYGARPPLQAVRDSFVQQAVLIMVGALTFYGGNVQLAAYSDSGGGRLATARGVQHRERIYDFIDRFNQGAGDLGAVFVDAAILSLINDTYQGRYVENLAPSDRQDTVIYMRAGRDGQPEKPVRSIMNIVTRNGLDKRFCLNGTTICMFTNRTQQQVKDFDPDFDPVS